MMRALSLPALLVVALLTLGVVGAPSAVLAVQPEEQLADPALEARARDISKQLRCVVCDNQTIDESDAQVAGDMRRYVRKRLGEGASDETIMDEIVGFYDEYVLLRPRFSLSNAFIWAAPLLALALGLFWALRRIGGPRPEAGGPTPSAASAPLSADEEARLKTLLSDAKTSDKSA